MELLLSLESNRISGFHVSQKDFKTQQRVVIEEFSEMYLNNPYGDFNHILMQMAYKTHPYRWPVIGFNQEQLKHLKLEDAEHFYHTYYTPSNAILVIHGNFNVEETKNLIQNYFGKIKSGASVSRYYPAEEK